MSEWQSTTLGDFVSLQRGHDLTDPERKPGSVPVMGSAGQNGSHDTALAKGPGVVIGRSGASFGQVHFTEKDYWPHNTCLYVTDFHGNDPRFAYYFLKSINFAGYNSGSAQPSLNRNFIYPIEIRVPAPEVQREIARILGAIDDKIEINRRMNDTLEAMARAIFNSWFVDFDPVRAKAGGEFPDSICQRLGMTTELLAQFPETFVESPLGATPAGWTVCALDDIAEYLNGLALQKFPAVEGDDWLPVIKIAQLRAGHTHTADKASTQVPPAYVVENGDVLFSWSGSLEVDIWCGGRGALNQHLFKVTSSTYPKWFYFLWTRHHLNAFRDIAANKATTMGHIQRKHLAEAMVVCPPNEVIGEMTQVVAPLLDRMVSARLESARLAAVRDTLLPELLSGRLEIEDAGELI